MLILELIESSFPLGTRGLWEGFVYLFLTTHASFKSHLMKSPLTLVFAQSCFQAICPSIVTFQPYCGSGLVTFDLVISQVFLRKTFSEILTNKISLTVHCHTKSGLEFKFEGWGMVNLRLGETATLAFFSASPILCEFLLDCEIDSK